MNIEEMILNGASEEEIEEALAQIRAERDKKLEEERKAQEAAEITSAHEDLIHEARAYLINAIVAYSEAFELTDEPVDEEDIAALEEAIIKGEKMVPMYKKLFELKEKFGDTDADILGLFGFGL